MQSIRLYFTIIIAAIALASCGEKADKSQKAIEEKKAAIEKLKALDASTKAEIAKLEKELLELDPSLKEVKPKLVSIAPINPGNFTHYIDLQGKIDADNIVVVTPRGMPGQVKALYVNQGDPVSKGKLLMKLDDAILLQQLEGLKTQLDFAKNIYQRQKNLWEQNIGTEVQLLTAKNNVESLEKNIATLKEQIAMTNVYAPISGVADEVNIKVGEVFNGATAMGPQLRLVNTSSLKVVAQVPENYLGKVKVGSAVSVTLPDLNQQINTKVAVAGKLIDPNSRSFYIEAKIPQSQNIQPNQVAQVKIMDYGAANAIIVPLNVLQNDEKGKFVMVAVQENGKLIARKKSVVVGELYNDQLEIKSGLQSGEQLITNGFSSLYEGQVITTQVN